MLSPLLGQCRGVRRDGSAVAGPDRQLRGLLRHRVQATERAVPVAGAPSRSRSSALGKRPKADAVSLQLEQEAVLDVEVRRRDRSRRASRTRSPSGASSCAVPPAPRAMPSIIWSTSSAYAGAFDVGSVNRESLAASPGSGRRSPPGAPRWPRRRRRPAAPLRGDRIGPQLVTEQGDRLEESRSSPANPWRKGVGVRRGEPVGERRVDVGPGCVVMVLLVWVSTWRFASRDDDETCRAGNADVRPGRPWRPSRTG